MKIIVFTGAQGTGKTQVATRFANRIGADFIESCSNRAVRDYAQLMALSAKDWLNWSFADHELLQMYMWQRTVRELYLWKYSMDGAFASPSNFSGGAVVFDRSIWDINAYTRVKFAQGKVSEKLVKTLNELTQRIAADALIDYTFILHPDPSYVVENNGMRDVESQLQNAAAITSVLEEFQRPSFHTIPFGSIQDKVDFAYNITRSST